MSVTLAHPAERHVDDPALGGAAEGHGTTAVMGDILATVRDDNALFRAEIMAGSAIERVELFNRTDLLETIRPPALPGLRLRVLWEGSEYRGRGRETSWHGTIGLNGGTWQGPHAINRFNLDHRFETDPTTLRFEGVTTGGFQALDVALAGLDGTLVLDTNLVQAALPLAALRDGEHIWEAGGLGRRMRAFLMPEAGLRRLAFQRQVTLATEHDNTLYLRATFEDGSVLWTSPVYLLR